MSRVNIEGGRIDNVNILSVNSGGKLELKPAARPIGVRSLSTRYELLWIAGQRGKPALNAVIQAAGEATRMIADPDFEILGTNASTDDVTFYGECGLAMETDGADGDEVILLPHLDANESAWEQVTWGTDKETEWECFIESGAAVTNFIIWAGLKLTNTEVKATDADQVFFRVEDGVNSGKWEAVSSIGGVDTEKDTGIAAVTADTKYHLKIAIDADRVARFYIDGTLVQTTAALTDTTDLKPYIGIANDGTGAAKTVRVFGQAISRVCG